MINGLCRGISKPGVYRFECGSKSLKVAWISGITDIEIGCWNFRSVQRCSNPSNYYALDTEGTKKAGLLLNSEFNLVAQICHQLGYRDLAV